MKPPSQTDNIIVWLSQGHPIHPVNARLMFSCNRLAARIKEIKDRGYTVSSELRKLPSGRRASIYWFGNRSMPIVS